jgi:hypothetical protein
MSATSTPLPAAPPDAANDHDARDAKGRFAKGNKGGPGNPMAGMVNKVRKAFLEYFDSACMKVLCEFMFRKALNGDPRYARIILQYTIGKLPTDDGFADFDADAALAAAAQDAAAEAAAELSDQLEECNGALDRPSDVLKPSAAVEVGNAPAAEMTPTLPAGLMDVPNPPRSKKRERLLNLIQARDPVCGDPWPMDLGAGPPSTNGPGDPRHVPLAGG